MLASSQRDATAAGRRVWIPPVSVTGMREQRLHVLLWQVRGKALLAVEDEERTLTAGYAMWVPAGLRHEFTVQSNSVTLPLFFPKEECVTTLDRPLVVTVDRDLRTLMLAYSVASHTNIKPEADLARQILRLLEDDAVTSVSLPLPESAAARLIAESLRRNPGDVRRIEELAESVHTSSRTIERAFRSETGMTLRQWRIRNRMEAAAALLRRHAGLDGVAVRVGYSNVNAFRRVFRAHFGVSPTVYAVRFQKE